ncbi:MAG: MFS transporter [Acidobacteriota bacterium]
MSEIDTSHLPPRGYLALLRENRDFRSLYIASLISLGGDWFLTVALLDLVLELSGSAALASLLIVFQTLPIFFATPFAGHVVDRMDRRKLMITVDLVRCGAALLPLAAVRPSLLVFAYLGVTIISLGAAWFNPASQAALPNLVEPHDLGRANVLIGSAWGTMLAIGAGIGGIVTAQLGRNTSFVIDAFTFLVSALILLRIRRNFSEAESHTGERPPLIDSALETVRYARRNPRVLALLLSKGGYGVGAGVVAMVSVFGREVFHRGAFGIGMLYAARGAGALAGPFIVRALFRKDDEQYRSISAAIVLFGISYIGLALSPGLGFGVLAVLVAHLGGGAQWLVSSYGLQREVPDYIRGRVFAADQGFVTLTISVSSLATGLMADAIGPSLATAIAASFCIAWGVVWGVRTRHLWRSE